VLPLPFGRGVWAWRIVCVKNRRSSAFWKWAHSFGLILSPGRRLRQSNILGCNSFLFFKTASGSFSSRARNRRFALLRKTAVRRSLVVLHSSLADGCSNATRRMALLHSSRPPPVDTERQAVHNIFRGLLPFDKVVSKELASFSSHSKVISDNWIGVKTCFCNFKYGTVSAGLVSAALAAPPLSSNSSNLNMCWVAWQRVFSRDNFCFSAPLLSSNLRLDNILDAMAS